MAAAEKPQQSSMKSSLLSVRGSQDGFHPTPSSAFHSNAVSVNLRVTTFQNNGSVVKTSSSASSSSSSSSSFSPPPSSVRVTSSSASSLSSSAASNSSVRVSGGKRRSRDEMGCAPSFCPLQTPTAAVSAQETPVDIEMGLTTGGTNTIGVSAAGAAGNKKRSVVPPPVGAPIGPTRSTNSVAAAGDGGDGGGSCCQSICCSGCCGGAEGEGDGDATLSARRGDDQHQQQQQPKAKRARGRNANNNSSTSRSRGKNESAAGGVQLPGAPFSHRGVAAGAHEQAPLVRSGSGGGTGGSSVRAHSVPPRGKHHQGGGRGGAAAGAATAAASAGAAAGDDDRSSASDKGSADGHRDGFGGGGGLEEKAVDTAFADKFKSVYQQKSKVDLEALAWRVLTSQKTGKKYYFSVLSGQTVWEKPKNFVDPSLRNCALADLVELREAKALCERYGVELEIVGPGGVNDSVYGTRISARTPLLDHCLFYQPFLVSELGLYPEKFVKMSGLKRIILAQGLSYMGQTRKAIPVVTTGTLYLDTEPEVIYYLQGVFHHEFFHIFDDKLLDSKLAKEESIQREEELYERRQQQAGGSSSGGGKFAAGSLAAGGLALVRSSRYRHLDLKKRSVRARNGEPGVQYDPFWPLLNPHGFRYGEGGAFCREHSAIISLDAQADECKGFLNKYSMSACEEDKAEVYAALIRYSPAILNSSDKHLQMKGYELRERLERFCPLMDENFFKMIKKHQPYPVLKEYRGAWEERKSRLGDTYWFNTATKQMSWINPNLYYGNDETDTEQQQQQQHQKQQQQQQRALQSQQQQQHAQLLSAPAAAPPLPLPFSDTPGTMASSSPPAADTPSSVVVPFPSSASSSSSASASFAGVAPGVLAPPPRPYSPSSTFAAVTAACETVVDDFLVANDGPSSSSSAAALFSASSDPSAAFPSSSSCTSSSSSALACAWPTASAAPLWSVTTAATDKAVDEWELKQMALPSWLDDAPPMPPIAASCAERH